MNQLALLPLDPIDAKPSDQGVAAEAGRRLVSVPRRTRLAPRTAVGAPGYLSVRAAAARLGLQPRGVRYLIERGRLRSQRLGRMHFLPSGQVEAYRRVRRERARRRQRRLA